MKHACLFVAIFLFAGCYRPLTHEISVTTQEIMVDSAPAEAIVYVDGNEKGITPLSVVLEKNQEHLVSIVKEGFKTEFVHVGTITDKFKLKRDAINENYWTSLSYSDDILRASDRNQKTGEYNSLYPSCIGIVLEPLEQESSAH